MNIKPILKYRFKDMLSGIATLTGVMIGVYALAVIQKTLLAQRGGVGLFATFDFAALVTMLVLGITAVREDLRLAIQNGVGRKTTFFAALLAVVASALVISIIGELMNAAGSAVSANINELDIAGIYDTLYMKYYDTQGMVVHTFLTRLESIYLLFSMLLLANLGGSLISLIFFRLNKVWTTAVAIAMPISFIMLLSSSVVHMSKAAMELVVKIFSSAPLLASVILLLCVVVAVLNWLLIAKAPIKAAAK